MNKKVGDLLLETERLLRIYLYQTPKEDEEQMKRLLKQALKEVAEQRVKAEREREERRRKNV